MWIADHWNDYEVIDCSEGEKLERWGEFLLIRPYRGEGEDSTGGFLGE